jgi:hypothetical protein
MDIYTEDRAKIIINDYLSGSITAKQRDKALTKEEVTLYYLNRGKGKITAYIGSVGEEKTKLNF